MIFWKIAAPVQNIALKIVKGPTPTLTVINSRIKGNQRGIWASYYNRQVLNYLKENICNLLLSYKRFPFLDGFKVFAL